ncbi:MULTISPECIES: hypothetical protein [Devosia]|uniref:hypothetical protein n=1 Tax=Devosia TaxID=46913 RepID=UPI000CE986BD|nr:MULTISPECIES: hypothetical protein [Devosia]AVF02916.1 hypothetical protein C4375_03645 [Devosia sp. I507]
MNLDTQLIAAEMSLTAKGQTRGESNQPPPDSKVLDQVESDIIEHVSASQKRAYDSLENHLAGFRQRLIDLDFETQFSNIRAASLGGLSDLKQELQLGLDDLHEVRRDLKDHEISFASFRTKHGIDRPAKAASARTTFFKVALIIALLLGEFVANGTLLSKGSELGLIGGILESVIFSFLNVGGALFFGVYLIPFVNHRFFLAKLVGAISFLAYLAFAFAVNLGLAHYREVAETIPEGAGLEVMLRLYERPLGLDDFQSWLLFALGVFFSLIAMIDGLTLNDSYPGFGRRDHGLRSARERYGNQRRETIETLGDVRKEYEEALTGARSDLGKQRSEHDSIVAHRLRLLALFDEHQAQLEKAANLLLRVYRDANVAARNTPAPSRFEEKFTLDRIAVSVSREGEWNEAELRQRIAAAQEEIDKLFVTLGKEFDDALERYRRIDDLAPDAS